MFFIKRGFSLLAFLLTFVLASCTPGSVTPESIPTPHLWHVQYTPVLSWLEPALNGCTLAETGYGLVVNKLPPEAVDPSAADITLLWGALPSLPGYTIEIGKDELVWIVNPQNPVNNLSFEQIKKIFSGHVPAWKDLDPGQPENAGLEVWDYPAGNEVRAVFLGWAGELERNPAAKLAPDPAAMRQAVSADRNAFGYLPRRWVNASVQTITVEGTAPDQFNAPLLANTPQEPDGDLYDWLICLQQSIQGNPNP